MLFHFSSCHLVIISALQSTSTTSPSTRHILHLRAMRYRRAANMFCPGGDYIGRERKSIFLCFYFAIGAGLSTFAQI